MCTDYYMLLEILTRVDQVYNKHTEPNLEVSILRLHEVSGNRRGDNKGQTTGRLVAVISQNYSVSSQYIEIFKIILIEICRIALKTFLTASILINNLV